MSKQQENLDQMRDRLDVHTIDKTDRKKLFEKFQEAGGQVEHPKDEPSEDKVLGISEHNIRPDEIENPFRQEAMPIVDNAPSEPKIQQIRKVSFMGLFFVRFACFLANIFNFSATRFSKKFTTMCTKTAFQEISSLKSFLGVLFQAPSDEVEDFKVYLAQNKMLLELEYLHHSYHLIHVEVLQQLNELMSRSVDESEHVFCSIFKELKFFYTYQKRMQTSIYIIAKQYEEYFQQKIYPYYEEKKVAQIFSFVWLEWFVWIEQLVTYYWKRHNNKSVPMSLNDFIHRGQHNTIEIGQLAKKWETTYNKKQTKPQIEEERNIESIYPNENVEKGVLFIKNYVDFMQYYDDFQETKDLRSLMPTTDKLFYVYILVDFFDREFSLAWNDVNFYVVPEAGGRFDAKKEIRLLHMQLMQFDELVNEFLRAIRSAKSSASTTPHHTKEREVSRSSFAARKMVLPILEEYRALFSRIISLKGKEQDCIGNWDGILLSSKNQENKALHGYSTENVVSFAYSYIDAMVWLLKYSDLSGLDGEIIEMEVLPDLTKELKTNREE